MGGQFSESYLAGTSNKSFSTRINERIEQGYHVISAFGDAHCCTVVYESSNVYENSNCNNTKLRPCPFCGNEAKIYERGGYDCWEPYWVIECTCCEAGMESFNTEEAAILAWNTREKDY